MSHVLTVVTILLIPAGMLPIVTAWVLRRYRHQASTSLRDRWHLSLVLAVLGGIVSLLAANRILEWGITGEALVLPFGIILLTVDLLSGRWLLDHWRGRFDLPLPETPEEVINRHAEEARRVLLEAADRTARDLIRAEMERDLLLGRSVARATEAAERTAEDQKRSADAAERTADAAERTADNTDPMT